MLNSTYLLTRRLNAFNICKDMSQSRNFHIRSIGTARASLVGFPADFDASWLLRLMFYNNMSKRACGFYRLTAELRITHRATDDHVIRAWHCTRCNFFILASGFTRRMGKKLTEFKGLRTHPSANRARFVVHGSAGTSCLICKIFFVHLFDIGMLSQFVFRVAAAAGDPVRSFVVRVMAHPIMALCRALVRARIRRVTAVTFRGLGAVFLASCVAVGKVLSEAMPESFLKHRVAHGTGLRLRARCLGARGMRQKLAVFKGLRARHSANRARFVINGLRGTSGFTYKITINRSLAIGMCAHVFHLVAVAALIPVRSLIEPHRDFPLMAECRIYDRLAAELFLAHLAIDDFVVRAVFGTSRLYPIFDNGGILGMPRCGNDDFVLGEFLFSIFIRKVLTAARAVPVFDAAVLFAGRIGGFNMCELMPEFRKLLVCRIIAARAGLVSLPAGFGTGCRLPFVLNNVMPEGFSDFYLVSTELFIAHRAVNDFLVRGRLYASFSLLILTFGLARGMAGCGNFYRLTAEGVAALRAADD